MNRWLLLIQLVFLFACASKEASLKEKGAPPSEAPPASATSNQKDSLPSPSRSNSNDSSFVAKGLVDIQSLRPDIWVDLKYASTDNFMGQRLYFHTTRCYLQHDVAERLAKVQAYLKAKRPDLSLLVYDGVRPLSVQQKMWDALDTIPVSDRVKFVSNPKNGSIHNYGAAVDLTLCDAKTGIALDMGAGYDDIRSIAYPRLEAHYLKTGELTQQHIDNRTLLREVMRSQGFKTIATEWWHFNAYTREEAKRRYPIVP